MSFAIEKIGQEAFARWSVRAGLKGYPEIQ